MKRLALSLLFCVVPVAAPAADSAWVQATASGFEARLVTDATACPVLHTDKGDVAMTGRAAATADFPQVCAVAIPAGAVRGDIAGETLPLPVANPAAASRAGPCKPATIGTNGPSHAWPTRRRR